MLWYICWLYINIFYGTMTCNIGILYAEQNLGGNGAEGNGEYVIEGTTKNFWIKCIPFHINEIMVSNL